MRDIRLYIGGSEVDFSIEESPILFQRQRTDYTNPTIVKNSFTKTIILPGTDSNNQIFNNLWKLDRTQWTGAFNPSKRVEFLLLKNGSLVEKGYVKLDNIVWDGKSYKYQVTLYGELGNILYELSYYTNQETDEVRSLNLGDLDFGFNGFNINIDTITAAWTRLARGEGSAVWDSINFMVSYDGVPQATNFDPQKVWVSVGKNVTIDSSTDKGTGDRAAKGSWRGESFNYQKFPYQEKITENGTTRYYRAINTMLTPMDSQDYYGLLELDKAVTPLEARDFRSYLLRPIVSVKGLFEAIGRYINTNLGYTLDLSDPFFSTDDFTKTWITLSMLWEVMPEVESNSTIYKEVLFKNTSTPASYLVSFCKVYGIYLDVDFVTKTFRLTRLPNFFTGEVEQLVLDKDQQIKITPLSFDKATYTFDYADGDGEALQQYKNTYGVNYGIKRVNTGYNFDAESKQYIDNNIFREAVDALETSIYYRYPTTVRNNNIIHYPFGFTDLNKTLTFKLFNTDNNTGRLIFDANTDSVKTLDGDMGMESSYTFGTSLIRYNISNSGYIFMDNTWRGLDDGVWNDSFPKLQFHSSENGNIDGKDVLVKYGGITNTRYGSMNNTGGKVSFSRESPTNNTVVKYIISDDNYILKSVLKKNCYYDNPDPDSGYGHNYITTVVGIPSFTRCTYDYSRDTSKIPVLKTLDFSSGISSTGTVVSLYGTTNYLLTTISPSTATTRRYPYISTGTVAGHRYFLAASVRSPQASIIYSGGYGYPDLYGSTLVSSDGIDSSNTRIQIVGSIVDVTSSTQQQFSPLSVTSSNSTVELYVYYMVAYDLTEMGLADTITTADQAFTYFGLTPYNVGFDYNISDTLDFGMGREIYVPACTVDSGTGVYNRFWSRYIDDLYSVNTRVFECYCFLPNISDVFRKFYFYDNSLWVISKIVDWIDNNKLCKATFIKVNNKINYTT